MRTAAALVLLALAAGCSTSGSSSAPEPTPSASNSGIVPPSVTASRVAEQKLSFGQSAKVAFRPNPTHSTTLEMAVDLVRAGRIRDLAAYALDDQTRASRPYYAHVGVTNLGPDDVGGSLVPLWATTSTGTVVAATTFTQPPRRCGSRPLQKPFVAGTRTRVCVLFLVPRSETLVALTNRSTAGDVAVSWTGEIDRPLPKKPGAP